MLSMVKSCYHNAVEKPYNWNTLPTLVILTSLINMCERSSHEGMCACAYIAVHGAAAMNVWEEVRYLH